MKPLPCQIGLHNRARFAVLLVPAIGLGLALLGPQQVKGQVCVSYYAPTVVYQPVVQPYVASYPTTYTVAAVPVPPVAVPAVGAIPVTVARPVVPVVAPVAVPVTTVRYRPFLGGYVTRTRW